MNKTEIYNKSFIQSDRSIYTNDDISEKRQLSQYNDISAIPALEIVHTSQFKKKKGIVYNSIQKISNNSSSFINNSKNINFRSQISYSPQHNASNTLQPIQKMKSQSPPPRMQNSILNNYNNNNNNNNNNRNINNSLNVSHNYQKNKNIQFQQQIYEQQYQQPQQQVNYINLKLDENDENDDDDDELEEYTTLNQPQIEKQNNQFIPHFIQKLNQEANASPSLLGLNQLFIKNKQVKQIQFYNGISPHKYVKTQNPVLEQKQDNPFFMKYMKEKQYIQQYGKSKKGKPILDKELFQMRSGSIGDLNGPFLLRKIERKKDKKRKKKKKKKNSLDDQNIIILPNGDRGILQKVGSQTQLIKLPDKIEKNKNCVSQLTPSSSSNEEDEGEEDEDENEDNNQSKSSDISHRSSISVKSEDSDQERKKSKVVTKKNSQEQEKELMKKIRQKYENKYLKQKQEWTLPKIKNENLRKLNEKSNKKNEFSLDNMYYSIDRAQCNNSEEQKDFLSTFLQNKQQDRKSQALKNTMKLFKGFLNSQNQELKVKKVQLTPSDYNEIILKNKKKANQKFINVKQHQENGRAGSPPRVNSPDSKQAQQNQQFQQQHTHKACNDVHCIFNQMENKYRKISVKERQKKNILKVQFLDQFLSQQKIQLQNEEQELQNANQNQDNNNLHRLNLDNIIQGQQKKRGALKGYFQNIILDHSKQLKNSKNQNSHKN